jgi:oligosaccharide repeat unit polymerase
MPLAIVLGAFVVLVEMTRRHVDQIDFLLPVSGLVFVCFVLVPIVLPFYKSDDLGVWGWVFERGIDGWNNAASVIVGASLYAISTFVYLKARKCDAKRPKWHLASITSARLTIVAVSLLAIALAAVAIFVNERGGIVIAVTEAAVFKTSEAPLSDLAFSIKLSPFATVSSFAFLHLYGTAKGSIARMFYGSQFLIALLVALLGLYLLGGRVSLITYILTFLLGEFIYRKKRVHIGAAALILFAVVVPVVLFGKSALRLFSDDFSWQDVVGEFLDSPATIVRLFVLEFSLPWVNVSNFLVFAPDQLTFRWFFDIPLAFAYLSPKLLLGIQLPPTINEIYDQYIDAPIPVDLASFGYISAGVAGVVLVAIGYGLVLRYAENAFADRRMRIWCLMRAAWILLLGAQVMYGSPYHFLTGGFTLLVSTALLVLAANRNNPLTASRASQG